MTVTITEFAANRIAEILQQNPAKIALRISVIGGGCSGFSYHYDLANSIQPDDVVIKKGTSCVVIDPLSAPFLEKATLDFVKNAMGEAFKIDNPKATSQCGCGISFTI